jgi:hypothetical protein
MACVESPDVLFFDIMTIDHNGGNLTYKIDQKFLDSCTGIYIQSYVASEPVNVGISVVDDTVSLNTIEPVRVTVTLGGVRNGFEGRRFAERTVVDFEKNNYFWTKMVRQRHDKGALTSR